MVKRDIHIQMYLQEQRRSLLSDDGGVGMRADSPRSGGIPAPDGGVDDDGFRNDGTVGVMDMDLDIGESGSGNRAKSAHGGRDASANKNALRLGVRWQALRRDTAFVGAGDPVAGVQSREEQCSGLCSSGRFFLRQEMSLRAPDFDDSSSPAKAVSRQRLATALQDAKRFGVFGNKANQETLDIPGGRNAPAPRKREERRKGPPLIGGGLAAMLLFMFALMTPATLPAQIPPPPGAPTESVPLPHPEIAPPDFPSWTLTPWWVVVGGIILGLALLSALAWYALLPKSLRPPSLRHAPLKSAIDSLEALRGRVREMAPSEVAHDVSLIIRMYLQQSYAVPAPYRTTEEIYRSAALATREPLKHRFEPVAVFYDQVEFAPRPRTVQDSEGLVEAALEALREEQRLMAQPAFVTGAPGMGPQLSKTPPPLPSAALAAATTPLSEPAPSASAPAPAPKLSLSKDPPPPTNPPSSPPATSDSAVSSSTSEATPVSNPP